MLFDDQAGRDSAIGRMEERAAEAEEHRQHKEMPDLEQVQPGQRRDAEHCQRPPAVRAEQHQPARQTIRRDSSQQCENQLWDNLGR